MLIFFLNKKDVASKSINIIVKVLLITGFVISKEISFFNSGEVDILFIKE